MGDRVKRQNRYTTSKSLQKKEKQTKLLPFSILQDRLISIEKGGQKDSKNEAMHQMQEVERRE
jgi:hypothetical protein